MKEIKSICPDCRSSIIFGKQMIKCSKCERVFHKNKGIINLLPMNLSENKKKEDLVHTLKGEDNSWYNNRIWYYLIHLSSHVIRFEKEILPKIKGPRVLELACGNSYASLLVKRKNPKFQVYSSDVSFRCLDIQARQMSKIMEVKPDNYIVCDAESLPFEDNCFDTVFVVASLHHFFDIVQALLEVKRVLKPGGSFYAFDGMMPKLAQKILGDETSQRTEKYGILERKLTYDDWKNFVLKAGMPLKSLRLNYDPRYIHKYATNTDEQKLIRENWVFNIAKVIIYQVLLSKMPPNIIIKLGLTNIFPAGIVIDYTKPRR